MATGKQYLYKVHEVDVNTLALDSLTIKDFTYATADFSATAYSVVKGDFPDSAFDVFYVKYNYPSGSVPAASKTITSMLQDCSTAIRATFGNTEVVSL